MPETKFFPTRMRTCFLVQTCTFYLLIFSLVKGAEFDLDHNLDEYGLVHVYSVFPSNDEGSGVLCEPKLFDEKIKAAL